MTQAHKTPGNLVKVKAEVFEDGNFYFPFCNVYKNHVFEVLDVPTPGHVMMRCVSGLLDGKDSSKKLEICLHDDAIQTLSPTEMRQFRAK